MFQPLDLTVNRSTKAFMEGSFTEWYSLQITEEVDSGKKCWKIEVKRSTLKPLHATWVLELYDYFISTARNELIANG